MSVWSSWRRGIRPADITWMPEDVELAPDWVREEIVERPHELQDWLSSQVGTPGEARPDKPQPARRRGRPKK